MLASVQVADFNCLAAFRAAIKASSSLFEFNKAWEDILKDLIFSNCISLIILFAKVPVDIAITMLITNTPPPI